MSWAAILSLTVYTRIPATPSRIASLRACSYNRLKQPRRRYSLSTKTDVIHHIFVLRLKNEESVQLTFRTGY